MKKFVSLIMLLILFVPVTPTVGETFEITNFKVEITFQDNDLNSSHLNVELFGLPSINNFQFELNTSDDTFLLDSNRTISLGYNFINYRDYDIVFTNGTHSSVIYSKTIPQGVWNHLTHVYSNWTFGESPPPDGRGFGQGALADMNHMKTIMSEPISDIGDGTILAESIINLLLGTADDLNDDNNTEVVSDGYGFIHYTFGVRDHLRNSGNSPDSPSDIFNLATEYVNLINSTLINGTDISSFLEMNATDNSVMALFYRKADEMLTSDNLTRIEELKVEINDLLETNYTNVFSEVFNGYRNYVAGINETISATVTFEADQPISSSTPIPTATNGVILNLPPLMMTISILMLALVKKKR